MEKQPSELEDPPDFLFYPEPTRPKEESDDLTDKEVLSLAKKHFSNRILSLDLSTNEETDYDIGYKEGLLAKRKMRSLKIKDKSFAFSTFSAESKVVVSSASGLILSGKGIFLTLSWDSAVFANSTAPSSLKSIKIYPTIQVLHSVDVGRLTLEQGARLADFLALCSSGAPVFDAHLIQDKNLLFITVVVKDPRIILCLNQFSNPKIHQPIRFEIAEIVNSELFEKDFDVNRAISSRELRLYLTQILRDETIHAENIIVDQFASDNPLFDPT